MVNVTITIATKQLQKSTQEAVVIVAIYSSMKQLTNNYSFVSACTGINIPVSLPAPNQITKKALVLTCNVAHVPMKLFKYKIVFGPVGRYT